MDFIKYSAQHKVVKLDFMLGSAQLTKVFKKCKEHFLYHGGNIVTNLQTRMSIYFYKRLTDDVFNTNPPGTFDEKVQRYQNVFVYYVDAKEDKYIIYLK